MVDLNAVCQPTSRVARSSEVPQAASFHLSWQPAPTSSPLAGALPSAAPTSNTRPLLDCRAQETFEMRLIRSFCRLRHNVTSPRRLPGTDVPATTLCDTIGPAWPAIASFNHSHQIPTWLMLLLTHHVHADHTLSATVVVGCLTKGVLLSRRITSFRGQ